MLERLINLARGKRVHIFGHWDTDGVASAGILFHLLKPHAVSITTSTKGKPFLVEKSDVRENPEVIVCTDIMPSMDLFAMNPRPKIAYIDHHPNDNAKSFDFTLHNPNEKSTTLLIYNKLMKNITDPYLIFLVLLGYFGDGGNRKEIPAQLFFLANALMPEMMQKRDSFYSDSWYFEIEKYVSALNTGKRMNWSGDIPLELLKSIDSYEPFVRNLHPLALQLSQYKQMLKESYNQEVTLNQLESIDYILIEDKHNVQGVLAARHISDKPIIVMNILGDEIIGSMRVPESSCIDAGKFLSSFAPKIDSFIGGGHEKAGGFTLDKIHLTMFIDLLYRNSF